jgi:hypothetical protein
MKIQQKDLFHGAALTQLTEHPSFKALNKADAKYGHYLVNADCRLMVKLTAKGNGPWQFTFQPDDLNTLKSDIASGFKTFVVLVCGKKTICLLNRRDFRVVIDLNSASVQWVRVEIPRARMSVRGSKGALKHAIAHNNFPDKVFA